MKLLLPFFILLGCFSFSQEKIELSKNKEKEGWQHYFDNESEQAKVKFQEALKINPENKLSKIGLILTSTENEFITSDDTESFFNDKNSQNDSMRWMAEIDIFLALFMDKEISKMMSEKENEDRMKFDVDYIFLRNLLLETPFEIYNEDGTIRNTGQFKNLRPVGSWKTYDSEGKIMMEIIYPEKGNLITGNHFTDKEELAKQIISEGDPLNGSSRRVKETIYWQENTGKEPPYLFVSKEGFVIYDKEKSVVFDKNTPDNIIEKVWESGEMKSYIWRNGKREPYTHCEEDGVYGEFVNGVKTEYRWENCKKIIISKTKINE